MSNEQTPFIDLVAGGFGAVCIILVGHPLDTIKVRLQTMPLPVAGQPPLYEGTWHCAVKIVKREGFRGLYRGMTPPLVGVAPIVGLSFYSYNFGKQLQEREYDPEPLTKPQLFLAGAFSGIFGTIVMAPVDRVKCLLQIQQDPIVPKIYSGPLDIVKKLYRTGGVPSIYKGTGATLLRDVPANGIFFMTYEWIQEFLKRQKGPESEGSGLISNAFAGGMAGIFNWVVGIPADVLKTRLQTAQEGMYPGGVREVFHHLMQKEGFKALFRGSTPIFIRAFPAYAVFFVGSYGWFGGLTQDEVGPKVSNQEGVNCLSFKDVEKSS